MGRADLCDPHGTPGMAYEDVGVEKQPPLELRESYVFLVPPPQLTRSCVLQCPAGGCLSELAQELLVIMVGKQIINNVQEVLVP